jgi:hypothetical protein
VTLDAEGYGNPMSNTYHFVCVSCADVIDVGKIVDRAESGEDIPIQFGGWRDQATSDWLRGAELWRLLERWHILHRGHEIRLIPEPFLHRVDPEGQLHYHDTAQEVFEREVQPLPDDELDARQVPSDVATRLRTHLEKADRETNDVSGS